MKKKIYFICTLITIFLFFSACGTHATKNEQLDPIKTIYTDTNSHIAVSDSGVYFASAESVDTATYITIPSRVMYYDFSSGISVPLCSNPQCTHMDKDTCNAVFYNSSMDAFFISNKHECLQGIVISDSKAYSLSLDGSSRETIADLGLISAAGQSLNYSGTYAMSDDNMFYTVFQKDGSASIYFLPLYQNASPQKIYTAPAQTLNGYSVTVQIWPKAICGNSLIFQEDTAVTVPDGVTAADIGRNLRISSMKYYNANTGTVEQIAEGYYCIAPYGSKYLLAGQTGLASWDPSANEIEELTLPYAANELYSKCGTIFRLYYDNGVYYMGFYYYNADGSEEDTILVLNEQLQVKTTIRCGDFYALDWNDDYLIASGYDSSSGSTQRAFFILPKSELENQTEITWEFENMLE